MSWAVVRASYKGVEVDKISELRDEREFQDKQLNLIKINNYSEYYIFNKIKR